MIDKKLVSKISSIISSLLILFLVIYFLPEILMIFGVIVLLLIIATFAIRLALKRRVMKMNFTYNNATQNRDQTQGNEEIQEMKDVTNSNKP